MGNSISIPNAWSSSTRPGHPPTWRVATVAAGAASGCARACPTDIGRPPPSSPACAAPAWWRRWCSTARSTATRSLPMSARCWCPSSRLATSSSWTTCRATRRPPRAMPSKRRAPGCYSFHPRPSPGQAPQPRLQPDRAGGLQAQGTPAQGRRAHYPRPVGGHRPHPRPVLATGVCQLLRQRRIRCRLIGNRSKLRRDHGQMF